MHDRNWWVRTCLLCAQAYIIGLSVRNYSGSYKGYNGITARKGIIIDASLVTVNKLFSQSVSSLRGHRITRPDKKKETGMVKHVY